MSRLKTGSSNEFDQNWKQREESLYNHWTADYPKNQIQFAFSQHWKVFSSMLSERTTGKCLEVGCGRGSISSYFAEHGWQTTLLDYSYTVVKIAQNIFKNNLHKGFFVTGDANNLPFLSESFDVVLSIGLLEHFENPENIIKEQIRVLKPGGVIFAYIVPERPDNVQKYFNWCNGLLKLFFTAGKKRQQDKVEIYRNDYGSEVYLPYFLAHSDLTLEVTGIYSMPMISYSPEFPFSLLPVPLERILVAIFSFAVKMRHLFTKKHGWLCSEQMGQAFLITARKSN